MKRLLILPLILLTGMAAAQQTSGIITYERKLSLDKKNFENSNLPVGFTDMLKEQKSQKVLYFSPDATLYENGKEQAAEEYSEGNVNVQFKNQEAEEKVFTDIKNNRKTEQKDLMGKQFLIESKLLSSSQWKMTGRQKKILNMPCMEAVMIKNDKAIDGVEQPEITAWYTSSIPVSSGPMGMNGLPGMIMELSIGDNLLFTAVKVDPLDAKKLNHIQAPTKGKKITSEAYHAVAKKKMEELKRKFGGEGNVIFKVEQR